MASKTREKLIEVARQLFVHKGVAHTTMNDIANASAKGRRTIYTYFRNKKEIYNAVLEQESELAVKSLRDVAESAAPVDDRLRRFLHTRLESNLLLSPKTWFSFDSRRYERVRRMSREKENAMLADLLAEGCDKGVFRADRCQLLNGFVLTSFQLDTHGMTAETSDEYRKAFDSYIEFVLTDIMA